MRVQALPATNWDHPIQSLYQAGNAFSQTIPLSERVFSAYKTAIKSFLDFLKNHDYRATRMIIAPYLLEPFSVFKASCLYPLGWKAKLQCFGLNPSKITLEQSRHKPLLLLHGNYHNQSAWLKLAHALQKVYQGPLYTVNLHNGNLTEKDRPLIEAKIEEIKKQYKAYGKEDIEIDIIGHSRGATVAGLTALDGSSWRINEKGRVIFDPDKIAWRSDIGNIIRIGSPTLEEELSLLDPYMRSKIFEIDGKDDCDVEERSLLDQDHRVEIPCGHLTLLFASEVHAAVLQRLQNCNSPHRVIRASNVCSASLSA